MEKIRPNPLQPRREFDPEKLNDLKESIRQYGVLQPLVVTRVETETPNGTNVEYELIAGERRWRASKLAGLSQVPVVIQDQTDDKFKLEVSIIENVQREDLNPIERAIAFNKLVEEFKLRHHEVAVKVGKSREYVSNTIRLLNLPQEIRDALVNGELSEGHCRAVLMISDNPEEQIKFYKNIVENKLSVRKAEKASRDLAIEKTRKQASGYYDPDIAKMEKMLSLLLKGIVKIQKEDGKGRVMIEFLSDKDLASFVSKTAGIAQGNESENESEESNENEASELAEEIEEVMEKENGDVVVIDENTSQDQEPAQTEDVATETESVNDLADAIEEAVEEELGIRVFEVPAEGDY